MEKNSEALIDLTHEQLGSIYKSFVICMRCGRRMIKMAGYQMGLRDIMVGSWDCKCGNRIDLVQRLPHSMHGRHFTYTTLGRIPFFEVEDLLGWEGLSEPVLKNLRAAIEQARKEMGG